MGKPGRAPWLQLEPVYLLSLISMSFLKVQVSLAVVPVEAKREGGWVSTGWDEEPVSIDTSE